MGGTAQAPPRHPVRSLHLTKRNLEPRDQSYTPVRYLLDLGPQRHSLGHHSLPHLGQEESECLALATHRYLPEPTREVEAVF